MQDRRAHESGVTKLIAILDQPSKPIAAIRPSPRPAAEPTVANAGADVAATEDEPPARPSIVAAMLERRKADTPAVGAAMLARRSGWSIGRIVAVVALVVLAACTAAVIAIYGVPEW
jgi:hypothetical protein